MKLADKKKLAFEWFGMSELERFRAGLPIDMTNLSKKLKIRRHTVFDWEKEYYSKKLGEQLQEVVEPEEEYDSQDWLKNQGQDINKALINACKSGNAQALKIYFQLTEQLVEKTKQEVTHKIDGSYLTRELLRAERELEDSGVVKVKEEPPLLRQKLRLLAGQSQDKDN